MFFLGQCQNLQTIFFLYLLADFNELMNDSMKYLEKRIDNYTI